MKHIRRHIARVAASCLCTLLLLPQAVLAEPQGAVPDGSGLAEIALQAQSVGESDPFAPEEGFLLSSQASRPSHFDLRNAEGMSFVTPVRQQNPYGTCWGFGAIAAAESSILSSGLASDPTSLDLSEKQVAWFNATSLDDPNSSQNGEGMIFDSGTTAQDRYDIGGITVFATSLFAAGVGPTSETTSTADGLIFRYSGRNGEVVNDSVTWLDNAGQEQRGFKKVYYSEDDDWTMSEAYRFHQDYQLRESYLLPSPALIENDDDKGPAIDAIKDQLLAHHAVAINFCAESSQPGQETNPNSALSVNWAQYESGAWPSNHVVTIVGYDDNYPTSKFAAQPPHNGAWLVKNSWGSDLNEFPNNGYRHWGLLEGQDIPGSNYEASSKKHTGYFWLSYYDRTIRDPEAYIFDAATPGIIIDQYDYMPVTEYEQYATEAENRTANVFCATQSERLRDVAFMTATPGTTVSYQIYRLGSKPSSPVDGTCVYSSAPKEYPYGGYHRETIDDAHQVILAKGQKYSVVVEQRTPSGKYSISFPESDSQEKSPRYRWFKAVVNEGESCLYIDDAWHDLSDDSFRSVLKDEAEGVCIDNFSIKAYATPVDTGGAYLDVKDSGGRNAADLVLELSDTKKYRATIRGNVDDLAVQPTFAWTSSDESIITVEPNAAKGNAEAVVRPVHYGEAYLTVDAGIYGSKTIHVSVPKLPIVGANLAEGDRETVYTGRPYEPVPIDVYARTVDFEANYHVVRDVDYEVLYENNVLCGMGSVTVRGIGEYGGAAETDFFNHLSFVIVPAQAHITKVTPGKGALTVAFDAQKASGISGYELSYTQRGTSDTKTMKVAANASSAVIKGLEAGASYDISLRAYVTVTNEDDEQVDHFGAASDVVRSGAVLGDGSGPSDGSENDATTVADISKKITSGTGEPKGSAFLPLRFKARKVGQGAIALSWTKVKGAKGYLIFGNKCGSKYLLKQIAEVKAPATSKTIKGLTKGTQYKYLVVAYTVKGNVKKVVAKSKMVHAATTGGKVTNYKTIALNKKALVLAPGKSFKLKVTTTPVSKKLKLAVHRKVSFVSSKKAVATVSASGKIVAKKKGTCYVYAYTQNGLHARVKVTVK